MSINDIDTNTIFMAEHDLLTVDLKTWATEESYRHWELEDTVRHTDSGTRAGLRARDALRAYKPRPRPTTPGCEVRVIDVHRKRSGVKSIGHGAANLLTPRGIRSLIAEGVTTVRTAEGGEDLSEGFSLSA